MRAGRKVKTGAFIRGEKAYLGVPRLVTLESLLVFDGVSLDKQTVINRSQVRKHILSAPTLQQ